MAFKIEWKPVLQPLMLKEYHPDYGSECILVCVNPQPGFWKERTELLADYARKLGVVSLLEQKAKIAAVGEGIALAQERYTQAMDAFLAWGEKTFIPAMHAWFARLWSYGDDQYTVADLEQFQEIDPHFATWLKARSIEMIEAHASARKKV